MKDKWYEKHKKAIGFNNLNNGERHVAKCVWRPICEDETYS